MTKEKKQCFCEGDTFHIYQTNEDELILKCTRCKCERYINSSQDETYFIWPLLDDCGPPRKQCWVKKSKPDKPEKGDTK